MLIFQHFVEAEIFAKQQQVNFIVYTLINDF